MDDREAYEFYKDPEHLKITGPGHKRKGQPPRLSGTVPVRFTTDAITAIKRWATEDGVTVSGWIRRTVAREDERRRRRWLDAHRHELEVVPGSGRLVAPRAIPSSLSLRKPGTFVCPHLSIGNVTSASCGTCGSLQRVA